ncbi:hypothetical protein EVAR_72531_1 [Eumeta japonica]|uniref:Uncharacterized protein n=1 Tax=Eumeta variegata TaxID=151549 RepID=A0A4C1TEU9_EUMVA|nr:hypothetical protein EVAR_72531_1 [Eumeta japonica]
MSELIEKRNKSCIFVIHEKIPYERPKIRTETETDTGIETESGTEIRIKSVIMIEIRNKAGTRIESEDEILIAKSFKTKDEEFYVHAVEAAGGKLATYQIPTESRWIA